MIGPDSDRQPPLLGRDAEIERVERILGRLSSTGGALLVKGPAGIGKSAILVHARERAEASGFMILVAEGVESEAELAFAGLHQLLLPVLDRIDRLPGPQREALEAAFGRTSERDPDPFHVALASHELLLAAADIQPVVLLADDAQWLDLSTVGVLTFIARRLQGEPVALLATARDERPNALEEARIPTLELGPLAAEESARLLDDNAPDLHPMPRSHVLSAAAGNPLALIELGRSAPSSSASTEALLSSSMTLTERLQREFAIQLDDLDEESREALLVAALDQQASLGEIIAATSSVSGRPTHPSVLDVAVSAKLVEVSGDRVRFTHPLIRSAVSQAATAPQRRAGHHSLAEAVVDPERRLWHRARATIGPDDELADALDAQSSQARRRGAVVAAAAALERAAELTSDGRRRGERLVRAAEVVYELGLVERVRDLLIQAEAAELGGLESAQSEWLRLMIAGDFWTQPGITPTFVGIAKRMAEAGDRDMAIRSLVPIAHRAWWVRSPARTREYLVAAARATGVADDEPRLLAISALTHPALTGGEVRRVLALHPTAAITDPVAELYYGIAAEKIGDLVAAVQRLGRATELLREQGRLGMLAQALVHQAWSLTYTGDWSAAVDAGLEGADLARDTRQPQYGLTGELVAAVATAMSGDAGRVEEMLERPEARLLTLGGGPLLAPAHLARGATLLGDGRHEEAFAQLWPVFDPSSPAYHRFMRWPVAFDLVEAAAGSGNEDKAKEVLGDLEVALEVCVPPILEVGVVCARPLLADDETADALFSQALAQDLFGYPFLRARTSFAYGRWLRRHRRNADARVPLRLAEEVFDALGATAWSSRTRQELRATGERTKGSPEGRAQLTPQERRVAELAAQGLSNREIGERLYLSHRTVGAHLYRIYPKLGVTARAQLRDALPAPSKP